MRDKKVTDYKHFSILRTVVVGLILIAFFAIPYFGYPFFTKNLVGLEGTFKTGLILLAISTVISLLAIFARRRWKNGFTRAGIILAALMTIGSLLLFFGHSLRLVGNNITASLFSQSGLAGALFIIPFFSMIAAGGLSWLISWWLLPMYRYLSRGKVMHSLLAAFLALFIWSLLGYVLSVPAMIQGGVEKRAIQQELTTVTYDVSKNTDMFDVQSSDLPRKSFEDSFPAAESRPLGISGITVVPKPAAVSGEFFVQKNPATGATIVQFRDSSGQVLEESGDVCAYDFLAPKTFTSDQTKYASQVVKRGLCEELFVYDATKQKATTLSDPGRMFRWLDNQYALLFDYDRNILKVYDSKEESVRAITVPDDRFRGADFNPMSMVELGTSVAEDKPWLALANPTKGEESCEILLLDLRNKKQVVLTGLPADSGCSAAGWGEGNQSVLVYKEGTQIVGSFPTYRLKFLGSDSIFSF
jgi:hypothetical protein